MIDREPQDAYPFSKRDLEALKQLSVEATKDLMTGEVVNLDDIAAQIALTGKLDHLIESYKSISRPLDAGEIKFGGSD